MKLEQERAYLLQSYVKFQNLYIHLNWILLCDSYCKRNLKHANLALLHMDGFNENLTIPFDVFFSSLPYYESRNAVTWLCQRNFRRGIILLQREFVEKLLSNPGEKNYRAISILSQYRFSINKLLDVPRTSFSPSPKVDSVLIEMCPRTSPLTNKVIKDIQFLLSFRKKTTSFIVNYFKKNSYAMISRVLIIMDLEKINL